jgi:hypothetical protein
MAFTRPSNADRLTWNTYSSMRQRCYHPSHNAYPAYGGAGIRVCDRWLDSYDAFVEDMGERPSKGHSIDRIDNSKGYEPGNCRWSTAQRQARNRRDNLVLEIDGERVQVNDAIDRGLTHLNPATIRKRMKKGLKGKALLAMPNPFSRQRLIEFKGERRNVSGWARHLGIDPKTLDKRINGYGWPIERALMTPTRRHNRRPHIRGGRKLNIAELARRAGLTYCCVNQRLKKDWPLEAALRTPSKRGRYLTDDVVRQIRRLHAAGTSQADICRTLPGLTRTQVHDVVAGHTYKHVQDDERKAA